MSNKTDEIKIVDTNTDDEKTTEKAVNLGVEKSFELREKRLKLVYRILYAVVAIWIAVLLCVAANEMTLQTAPFYAFLLSASSLVIINIVKYALMEFRCMKIANQTDDNLANQTEERYENIWNSFPLIMALDALLMIIHFKFSKQITFNALGYVFALCEAYYLVVTITGFFKKRFKDKTIRIFDIIGLFVSVLTAYAICALACMVTI